MIWKGSQMERIKEDMARYWTKRADKFSELRQREFACEKHEQWIHELEKHLPKENNLRILDIGTGTGFFAFLLAEKGHRVTGIDITPKMIEKARKTAEQLSLPVEFAVMDAENPQFEPNSFDVIVTRKLTWTLPNLPKAYKTWHSLLKKGGVLINFDADYCREKPAGNLPKHHAHEDVEASLMREYERMKNELRTNQMPRPEWDKELLKQAGFENIKVDCDVWKRVYSEIDEFYDPTPGFSISATA